MITPHSGSNLLTVESTEFSISFSPRNESGVTYFGNAKSDLTVFCAGNFDVEIKRTRSKCDSLCKTQCDPLFFEQMFYEVVIETQPGVTIEKVEHVSDEITKCFKGNRSKTYCSGTINFRNDIGYSDFIFVFKKADGALLKAIITVEVLPFKIDYKTDYEQLISDVTNEVYGMVFDYLQMTYHSFNEDDRKKPSLVVFFSKIQQLFAKFEKSLRLIIKSPNRILRKRYSVTPPHKVKKTDNKTLRWLEKHPESFSLSSTGITYNAVLSHMKEVSYDTKENRFVKYITEKTIKSIGLFSKLYSSVSNHSNKVIEDCYFMQRKLKTLVNSSFLKDIQSEPDKCVSSMVFQMAPGYKELYKYHIILSRGLSISSGIFDISLKDVAKLYEIWCFIKLNSLLREEFDLVSSDLIKTNSNGLVLDIDKGHSSEITYAFRYNPEETVTIGYNVSQKAGLDRLPTVAQKPDNILSIKKSFSGVPNYEYIFDAKYKIQNDEEYVRRYGGAGPKEEDINTMHRYKDSIVDGSMNKRIYGAFVLFPMRQNSGISFKNHRLYKSIDTVNVGGLPFLPGETDLVKDKMLELIYSEGDCLDFVPPYNWISGLDRNINNWNRKDCLIVKPESASDYGAFLTGNVCYCKCPQSIDPTTIRSVALYKTKKIFGNNSGILKCGRVVSFKSCRLKDVDPNRPNGNSKIILFNIEKWEDTAHRIYAVETHSFPFITSRFLLDNVMDSSMLLCSSETEYRLYRSLKRLLWDFNGKNRRFEINGHNVSFGSSGVLVDGNVAIAGASIDDFVKKPHKFVNNIVKSI